MSLKEDVSVQLSKHFHMQLAADDLDLQLEFRCQECHITASLRDGPMLAERIAASDTKAEAESNHGINMTAAAPMPVSEGAAVATGLSAIAATAEEGSDDMKALLNRARLLMAASESNAVASAATPAANQPSSPADPQVDADDTKALLAQARTLMKMDYAHLTAGNT
jgi:hypothetical protein